MARLGWVALFWLLGPCAWADPVVHELAVRIDPAAGVIAVHDRITIPAGASPKFELNAGLELTGSHAHVLPLDAGGAQSSPRRYRLQLPPGERTVELSYRGRLVQPGPDASDAVIDADTVLLGPDAGWYADFDGLPVRFDLRIDIAEGWRSVSQGESDWVAPTAEQRWHVRSPQQGIWLIAAPFVRYQRDTAWGTAQVFLRAADEPMAREYLDATAEYLGLYSKLIGPYPYPKFALVENIRQTGYGMPSFTLLGSRVIRLPFIVHTSYPHEILHNWWGNGVWVDYSSGNWAEALTTYLADYLLAERRGKGMQQRRAALQKYADFVAAHNDFPLQQFRARHGEASQAIGYSKGMMLFHMLRRQLGDQTFVAALRQFYRQYQFRTAGFADLERVFGQVGQVDLGPQFRQWLQRPGAPELALKDVRVTSHGERFKLRFQLRQTQAGDAYALHVPVAVQLAGRTPAVMRTVVMDRKTRVFEFDFEAQPQRIAIDPAFDVFRRLSPRELPPSLGSVLGAQGVRFVLPRQAPPPMRDAYLELARQWAGPGDEILWDDEPAAPPHGTAWILGRGNRWATRFVQDARDAPYTLAHGRLQVADSAWTLEDHNVVLVRSGADGAAMAWLSATDPDAIAALARKVPHYSRYGYLVFDAAQVRNMAKGEWPVTGSPLQRALVAPEPPPLELPEVPPLTAVLGPGAQAAP